MNPPPSLRLKGNGARRGTRGTGGHDMEFFTEDSKSRRRQQRRRLGRTEVVYRTASGGTLIVGTPDGRRARRLRSTVPRT